MPPRGLGHVSPSSTPCSSQASSTTRPRQRFAPSRHPRSRSSSEASSLRGTYNMDFDDKWKQWPEVTVVISHLAHNKTTRSIYQDLKTFGAISRIGLKGEGRVGSAGKTAFVIFQPPPATAFWKDPALFPRFRMSLKSPDTQGPFQSTMPDPLNPKVLLPKITVHQAARLEFGFMFSEDAMMPMYDCNTESINVTLDLERRHLDMKFNAFVQTQDGLKCLGYYMLQMPFQKLTSILCETATNGDDVLTIPSDAAPLLYRQCDDVEATHDDKSNNWSQWDSWVRQTDVVMDKSVLLKSPISLRKDDAVIDVGRWNTYRVAFRRSTVASEAASCICKALSSFNVHIVERKVNIEPQKNSEVWSLLDDKTLPKSNLRSGYSSMLLDLLHGESYHLSFETRYQLEVCISRGYFHEANITKEFLKQLQDLDQKERDTAVGLLENAVTLDKRFFDPMEIFSLRISLADVVATRMPPSYCSVIRSATITPTMIYFDMPGVEISNRVIREYQGDADRFLRIRFTDEKDSGRIRSQTGSQHDEVYARVGQTLRNGIRLGNHKYEFLAFGSSQFREHGAWFFAPRRGLTADNIRQRLGRFLPQDQRNPAKICARMGQNFSTTRGLTCRVQLQTTTPDGKPVLPDVKRNGFNFTDGVGKLSPFLAKIIAGEFGLPSEDAPSVFQFRLGGCKGVLAVDPKLNDRQVQIRPSQYKFAAMQEGLEIIRTSSFVSAFLNRQIILVLSTLGVPDSVFLEKLHDQLTALDRAMHEVAFAVRELEKVIDVNQTTLTMAGMASDGFMETKDPFMMATMHLWRSWSLKFLKEKAKINIDKGALLLGCVDETATLQGHDATYKPIGDSKEMRISKLPQVFCCIDQRRNGRYQAVTGVCILARNPSLHPGDIRVVNAVDVPQLRHLKNVIVMPQLGDRDVSNMCSGGDLDGDDYMLIWDQAMIPQEWNHPAMDFTPVPPRMTKDHANLDDMTKFFIDYMKNDQLAIIAHAHVAFADSCDTGVKDPRCLQLAELHSHAVDYAKSGEPAKIPRHLKNSRWPHFMEKRRTAYRSHKILGQIYDRVCERVEKSDSASSPTGTFDKRILDAYQHDQRILSRAAELKTRYDSQIRRIMMQHNIKTEFEVWTGFVIGHNGNKKDFDIAQELGTIMEAVKKNFREECEKFVNRDQERLLEFVAAMYTVTAKEVETGAGESYSGEGAHDYPQPLMSFPWLFTRELGKIACGEKSDQHSVHRVQEVAQRHLIRTGLAADDAEGGAIETAEGVVACGEILRPFPDVGTSSKNAIKQEEISDLDAEFRRLIDAHVVGGRSSGPETGREVRVRLLRDYTIRSQDYVSHSDDRESASRSGAATLPMTPDDHIKQADERCAEKQQPAGVAKSPTPDFSDDVEDGDMNCEVEVKLDLGD